MLVIAPSEEVVIAVSRNISKLVDELSLRYGILTQIDTYLLIDFLRNFESMTMNEKNLLGELMFWQGQDQNNVENQRQVARVQGLLAVNSYARGYLLKVQDFKTFLPPGRMQYPSWQPEERKTLARLVIELFLASYHQRLDILAERYPLLLQATVRTN